MSDPQFTHLDGAGHARMVDVTPKEPTHRRAVARCDVVMEPATIAAIVNREVKKGDVLSVARIAGIQAAKRTSDMIPLCHPLMIASVSINFDVGDDRITIEAHVDCFDRTGVEMEALHACSVAALTVYDGRFLVRPQACGCSLPLQNPMILLGEGSWHVSYRRKPGRNHPR